jgi:hypothetical protein
MSKNLKTALAALIAEKAELEKNPIIKQYGTTCKMIEAMEKMLPKEEEKGEKGK